MSDPTLPSPTQHPGQESMPEIVYFGAAVEWDRRSARAAALDIVAPLRAAVEYGWRAGRLALLADLDAAREALREAQSTVADLLHKRDAWQRRAEEATLRNADLAAERDRMRPVVEAAREWREVHVRIGASVDYRTQTWNLAAAVDTYETQTGGTDG